MTDDKSTIEAVQSICFLIFVVFAMGCTTYSCTQPDTLDPEAQAMRVEETRQMQACVAAGGSWLPLKSGRVLVGRSSYTNTANMSCVTDKVLPLVARLTSTGAEE